MFVYASFTRSHLQRFSIFKMKHADSLAHATLTFFFHVKESTQIMILGSEVSQK
jgi:hypothetical protein